MLKHKIIGTVVAVALAVGVVGVVAASATPPNPGHKVTLCHRTGSASNPYIVITTDIASDGYVKGGHDQHEQVGNGIGGDIIPAYEYQPKHGDLFVYPGKNLTTDFGNGVTGADILANGCKVPGDENTPADISASITGPSCSKLEYVVTLTNSGQTDGSATITTTINGSSDSSNVSVPAGSTVVATVNVSDAANGSSSVVVTFGEKTIGSADATLSCDHGGHNPPPGHNPKPPKPTLNAPHLAETL